MIRHRDRAITGRELFELRNVHRRFGGIHALRGASFVLRAPGHVHALLGANGCGKSTLLRVATGQLRPDSGEIRLDGEPVTFAGPRDALRRGIATVTQETTLAPDLTVAENVLMGRLPRRRWGAIDWPRCHATAQSIVDSLGLDMSADTLVRRLRPDQQQMVEIARALSVDARILVLDEATSALTEDEVRAVFAVVRNASRLGVATIFVSHRMDEIYELADEVTVLRDGRTVATRRLAGTGRTSLVADMIGHPPVDSAPDSGRSTSSRSGPRLQINGLRVTGRVEDASLSVAAGEIVGLTGLTQAGTRELLGAVFGACPVDAGQILFDGRDITGCGIATAIRNGIGYVPPDRKLQGVLVRMSVRHNLTMPSTAHRPRWERPRRGTETRLLERIRDAVSLRMDSPDSAVSTLSGGNQQKIVIGKWLAGAPQLLLLAEPSRGVDVAAKAQIHQLLRGVAAQGAAVLFASTELDEVRELADRVVVMFRGRIVADLPRRDADEHVITSRMAGAADGGGAR